MVAESSLAAIKSDSKTDITFNEDGTCTLGTYYQWFSKVIIEDIEYEVVGEKLVLESEEKEFSYKITYIEKK